MEAHDELELLTKFGRVFLAIDFNEQMEEYKSEQICTPYEGPTANGLVKRIIKR